MQATTTITQEQWMVGEKLFLKCEAKVIDARLRKSWKYRNCQTNKVYGMDMHLRDEKADM